MLSIMPVLLALRRVLTPPLAIFFSVFLFRVAGGALPSALEAVSSALHLKYGLNDAGRKNADPSANTGDVYVDLDRKRLRLTANREKTAFGATEISVLVDGETKKVATLFSSREELAKQCVQYDFPSVTEIAGTRERLAEIAARLGRGAAPSGAGSYSGEQMVEWLRGEVLEFVSAQDQVAGASVGQSPRSTLTEVRVLSKNPRQKTRQFLRHYFVEKFETQFAQDATFSPPFLPELEIPEHCETYVEGLHEPRLARVGLGHLKNRSLALVDLVAAYMGHDRSLMLLATMALPGDLAVFLKEPVPPTFLQPRSFPADDRLFLRFSSRLASSEPSVRDPQGSLWLDLEKRSLRLETTFGGTTTLTVIADGSGEKRVLYTNLEKVFVENGGVSGGVGGKEQTARSRRLNDFSPIPGFAHEEAGPGGEEQWNSANYSPYTEEQLPPGHPPAHGAGGTGAVPIAVADQAASSAPGPVIATTPTTPTIDPNNMLAATGMAAPSPGAGARSSLCAGTDLTGENALAGTDEEKIFETLLWADGDARQKGENSWKFAGMLDFDDVAIVVFEKKFVRNRLLKVYLEAGAVVQGFEQVRRLDVHFADGTIVAADVSVWRYFRLRTSLNKVHNRMHSSKTVHTNSRHLGRGWVLTNVGRERGNFYLDRGWWGTCAAV